MSDTFQTPSELSPTMPLQQLEPSSPSAGTCPPSTQQHVDIVPENQHLVLGKRSRREFRQFEADPAMKSLVMRMKMMVKPAKRDGGGQFSEKYPLSEEEWLRLFPESRRLRPRELDIATNQPSRRTYKQRRKLYALDCHDPEELQDIFGQGWHLTHERDCVGVFVCVKLSLYQHSIVEYQKEGPSIRPGSIDILSDTYLHICLHFRKMIRCTIEDREGEHWRERAAEVIEEYKS